MKPSWAEWRPGSAGPARALGLLSTLLLAACTGLLAACTGPTIAPARPVDESASAVFYDAWLISRRPGFASDDDARAVALECAEAALDLAPNWAAPSRFIDEWQHRLALTLPARYAEYRAAASAGDATAAYLVGRLGGDDGRDMFRRSVQMDPTSGWGWHGLAWIAFTGSDLDEALSAGVRAAGLASDPHELALFSWALARYLRAAEDHDEARGVLVAALEREGPLALRAAERAYIESELAVVELRSDEMDDVRRGVVRGLALIARPDLTAVERAGLATLLATTNGNLVARSEIAQRLLLAAIATDGVEAQGIQSMADRVLSVATVDRRAEPTAEDRDALERGELTVTRAVLVDAFDSGDLERIALTFAAWQAALPAGLRTDDAESVVRHEPLQRLGALIAGAAGVTEIAEALLDAGWFLEALGLSRTLRSTDPEAARDVEERALRGRATLDALLQLARRIDAREAYLRAGSSGSYDADQVDGNRLTSLRELQEEIVRTFQRTGMVAPAEAAPDTAATPLGPVIKYGPAGGIVHPGVTFSAEDEALGRGSEGADVPGLATLFRSMNRFALVGNGVGQGGPDATVLRIVHVEERSGAHLGRPFRGTVFWCQGADVPGRYGRLGAGISGAALHEGYYLDIEQIAVERKRWVALGKGFMDTEARARALEVEVEQMPMDRERRTEVSPALGAGDRMRLVLFEDLATRAGLAVGGGGGGDTIDPYLPLDVLTHVVGTHEEGHLCDRRQWYPLSFGRVMRLISFAGAHGFSGQRIAEALEERAQLVAIGACDDPRVPLVDLLDSAEGGGGIAFTPHAAAYRRLLGDLIDRLEREYKAGDWEGKGLDPDVRWIDQIHRFNPEDIRALAIREARARGLTGAQGSF